LDYSQRRLSAFLEEVQRLRGSEFPYPHSEHALSLIEDFFSNYLRQLKKLTPASDPSTIRAACAAELTGLFEYLPLLGFILRSTNPRNAFEVYGPLLRLARDVVHPSVKLVISSEWDYSPLTYLGITHLPDYVLIGLPAHESGNPLVLPLAGHELGHSIWATRGLSGKYGQKIDEKILAEIKSHWKEYRNLFPDVSDPSILQSDFFARQTWSPSSDWGVRQAEESFCDFAGMWLFCESYLHAFAYLLSPKQLWSRSVLYPTIKKRIENLISSANAYSVQIPTDYKAEFDDLDEPTGLDKHRTFLLALADAASASLIVELIGDAETILKSSSASQRSEAKVQEILNDFDAVAPATNAGCLANILNAGWSSFHKSDLWAGLPQIQPKERTLKELVLKSIEVFEYDQLLKVPL
jgi:hypothetical protein